MNELSLFTGAGGGVLGTSLLGWRPIGYVEWDQYCQRIIAARIRDGMLPGAPIFGDVREFIQSGAAAEYRGFADVVTAGFPCQPFSVAGRRAGADDSRNMWPATVECIRTVRPRYALLENVPGILTSGYFGTILGDLAESGYDARWRILSAAELGAPHKRDRLWIVAYGASQPAREHYAEQDAGQVQQSGISVSAANVPHADSPQRGRNGAQWQTEADTQGVGEGEQTDEANAFADGGQARHELGYSRQHIPDPERQGLAFGVGAPGERTFSTAPGGD